MAAILSRHIYNGDVRYLCWKLDSQAAVVIMHPLYTGVLRYAWVRSVTLPVKLSWWHPCVYNETEQQYLHSVYRSWETWWTANKDRKCSLHVSHVKLRTVSHVTLRTMGTRECTNISLVFYIIISIHHLKRSIETRGSQWGNHHMHGKWWIEWY